VYHGTVYFIKLLLFVIYTPDKYAGTYEVYKAFELSHVFALRPRAYFKDGAPE
jgi:hypothetical protein